MLVMANSSPLPVVLNCLLVIHCLDELSYLPILSVWLNASLNSYTIVHNLDAIITRFSAVYLGTLGNHKSDQDT